MTKGGLTPQHLVEQLITAVEDYHYCITSRLDLKRGATQQKSVFHLLLPCLGDLKGSG